MQQSVGPLATRAKPTEPHTQRPSPLVLVAEDYPDLRVLYAHILKQNGFRVALAGNGQEVIDLASSLLPDVIVMDVSMPGTGGIEATQKLKQSAHTKHIPILIVTCDTVTEPYRRSVLEIGAAACFSKDSLAEDLVRNITGVLDVNKRGGGGGL